MVKSLRFFLLGLCLVPALAVAATDKEKLDQARHLYAQGRLEQARELYTTIPTSSDFWLEAIEERAWVSIRQNKFENALADLQSITSSVFSSQVGPETYMLSTFVSLKVCNYKDVVAKIELFKKRMLPRVDALTNLTHSASLKDLTSLASSIKDGSLNLGYLGKNAELYPRYFFRDKELIQALKDNNQKAASVRLQKLAEADLKEIETNLKKMKIIEVELMQNVLMTNSKATSNKLKFSGIDSNKEVLFPVTDDEVWLDEVGQYQVRAQTCLNKKGITL